MSVLCLNGSTYDPDCLRLRVVMSCAELPWLRAMYSALLRRNIVLHRQGRLARVSVRELTADRLMVWGFYVCGYLY
jgi:hypothetical protein